MKNLLIIFAVWIFLIPSLSADSYIASRQELWFSDSSYFKSSHHIKIGKSFNYREYGFFGEVGEKVNLRFGITKTFFNSFRVNLNYRSKMKSDDRDLNWIVINTKYKF